MTDYCTRTDIENKFGADNIAKWADASNTANATAITNRINDAIEEASAYIDSRLAVRFDVPFDSDAIPVLIKHLAAKRVGVNLYKEPRGLADGSDESVELAKIEDEVKMTLTELLNGMLKLPDIIMVDESIPKVEVFPNKSDAEIA